MLNKISSFLKNVESKTNAVIFKLMGPCFAASLACMPVRASDIDMGEARSAISSIVDVMFTIFMYVGIVLLIWGIGQLVLAFRNEDADSKTRAIMLLVAAAALLGLRPIIESTQILNNLG